MHSFRLISLGALMFTLLTSTAASALSKRATAQDVNNDIYAIEAGVEKLTTDTSAYNSGSFATSLLNGVSIFTDVLDIHVANRKGYLDANTAAKFSSSDSITIVSTVESTVAIRIPNAVKVTESKKQAFQQSGLVPIVIAGLELLLNDHDTFSAAVVAKLTLDATDLARANAGIATIHNALEDGIAYFES